MYGDTAAMRKRAAQLREQGADVRAMADRLVAQAESVDVAGRAAESCAPASRTAPRTCGLRRAARRPPPTRWTATLGEVDRAQGRHRDHRAQGRRAGHRRPDPHAAPRHDDPAGVTREPRGRRPLLAVHPPPAGHKDWLTVKLPGL